MEIPCSIREKFGKGKNPLKGQTFSLDISFGTSKSYSRMESTTTEYAGSRIASGGNTNVSAGERDLTVKGSTVIGNDVSLTAKGNVRLEAGENTSITTTENKFSSASIGASFAPSGLTDISISANKGNGNSTESVTAYSPALVSAQNDPTLTSGKDMDIIGSKAQGEKITAKIGGNLNVETLQEKETYEEDNHSTGFGVSWNVNQTKKETTDANGDTKIETLRSFSKPTFSGSWNKGNIDSHYRSARDQAGFFAGSKGFDIYVEKNTDLKGGVIASEASADKNRLSTGTLSFSDLHNEAEYRAKDTGTSAQIKPTLVQTKKEDPEGNKIESLKVVQALHSTPSIPTVVQGSADSTTKAAVASGIIDIRENKAQDISALSRDTANALNELGRIFDKKSVEEQKELVNVFREEAFRLAHNLPDDGSGRKTLIHAAIGGLISQLSGAGFASGAAGAGLNEALINNLKGLDPTLAQIISGVLGAAAAKAINGNATAGAISAASGTKWNKFSDFYYFSILKFVWINENNVEYALNNAIITDAGTTEERMYLYMGDGDELRINTGHAYYRDHKTQRGGTIPSFRYTDKKELLTTVINCAVAHYAQGDLDKEEVYDGNEHVLLNDSYGKRVPVNLRITMKKIGNIFYISDFYPTALI